MIDPWMMSWDGHCGKVIRRFRSAWLMLRGRADSRSAVKIDMYLSNSCTMSLVQNRLQRYR